MREPLSKANIIIEMTYIGKNTRNHLNTVRYGTETLATLKRLRSDLYRPGDVLLSLDETINLLERQQCVEKTKQELQAQMGYYQIGALYTTLEPDLYVAPEIAHQWYEDQIERLRGLLVQQEMLKDKN